MAQVLRPVETHPATSHPQLLVGLGSHDDAGVYALGDGRALIQTVDIFTPVVDDPFDWGRIAAANALSDVYAMGGTPITALNYLAWPRDELDFSLASAVLEGGLEVMAEAGCTVVGGHSVDAPEPSFGFAVTGLAEQDRVVTNAGAQPGDSLMLTKPLGLGVVTTAIKRGSCPPEVAERAIEVMTRLNRVAGEAMVECSASAATDVTGFGLLGHLGEICRASGVGAVIEQSAVPVIDGAGELLEKGAFPGGSKRNLEAAADVVHGALDIRLLVDAQTSGGLLVALRPEQVDVFCDAVPEAAAIGEITAGSGIEVR